MLMDSVISWGVLVILSIIGMVAFLKVVADAHPAPRKDYGKVESMKMNLDWGKKK